MKHSNDDFEVRVWLCKAAEKAAQGTTPDGGRGSVQKRSLFSFPQGTLQLPPPPHDRAFCKNGLDDTAVGIREFCSPVCLYASRKGESHDTHTQITAKSPMRQDNSFVRAEILISKSIYEVRRWQGKSLQGSTDCRAWVKHSRAVTIHWAEKT